jgi:hypothetical protein
MMTGDQLRNELDGLGSSQVGFARFLGIDGRTVRSWIADDYSVPRYVEIIIDQLTSGSATMEEIAERITTPPRRRSRPAELVRMPRYAAVAAGRRIEADFERERDRAEVQFARGVSGVSPDIGGDTPPKAEATMAARTPTGT